MPRTSPESETSQWRYSAFAPSARTNSTVSSPASSLTSETITARAPWRAISTAVARPMPLPDPVTRQTLSSSRIYRTWSSSAVIPSGSLA